jgi:hypothetical protein
MIEERELINTELDTVCGGIFPTNLDMAQPIGNVIARTTQNVTNFGGTSFFRLHLFRFHYPWPSGG